MSNQGHGVYPWLDAYWLQLNRYLNCGRLPCALMLLADEGMGLTEFAQAFANRTVCLTPKGNAACGQCSACLLFNAGNYPDFYQLRPEEGKTSIRIDAIRELSVSLSLSAQYTKPRVVIIDPADAMLHQASNSLLKTLEEPSENTCLILIAHQLSKVPLTIRSRCQLLSLKDIDLTKARDWLEKLGCQQAEQYLRLANNAPLLAKSLWEKEALEQREALFKHLLKLMTGRLDPLVFAEAYLKCSGLPILSWLMSWFTDALKCAHGSDQQNLINPNLETDLKVLAQRLNLKQIHQLLDRLIQLSKLESTQVNQQLMLEEFAMDCYSFSVK